MRSLQELMDEVRHNTNNVIDSRHKDIDLIRFFNTAQRQIQRVIFTANPSTAIFSKDYIFPYTTGIASYKLPNDVYARGAINSVYPVRSTGRDAEPINRISEREQITKAGYYTKDNTIYISSGAIGESISQIRVSYTRRLPDFTDVSDVSDLPSECEDFLTAFVERKILAVDSSQDIGNFGIFSSEEKAELSELFSDTSNDIKFPTVSDETYVTY